MAPNDLKKGIVELVLIITGFIFIAILFIYIVTSETSQTGNAMKDMRVNEVNINPVAKVELAQATLEGNASGGKSGEEVYKAVCLMCHQAGLLNAPKFGDTQVWAPRILQGYDVLVQHAVKGIRSMPAKGGNAALSDAEVASAVLYMTNSSGANFKK